MTTKKQQGQGPGAAAGTAPSTAPQPSSAPSESTPRPGAAPKFCPSCGKGTRAFSQGKAAYCEDCEHVFDEGGQGRKADFADQLADATEQLRQLREGGAKDPRVDKLDQVVQKLTESVTGQRRSIDELDPNNAEQMGKLSAGLAFVKGSLAALFMPRGKPAPPAQGGK